MPRREMKKAVKRKSRRDIGMQRRELRNGAEEMVSIQTQQRGSFMKLNEMIKEAQVVSTGWTQVLEM
jgi:uncharacterized sporulation protein YeaH/YhbH (DUF444 family)